MATTVTMTEDQLQAKCTQWFDHEYPGLRRTLFAVPNGGLRDKRTANLLLATGVKRGVSDLIFVMHHQVVFIEMKTPTGTQSDEQIDFQAKVEARGHLYFIVRTFEQFKQLICTLIRTEI